MSYTQSSPSSSPTASYTCESDDEDNTYTVDENYLEDAVASFCSEFAGQQVWSPGSGMDDDYIRQYDIENLSDPESQITMYIEISPVPTCEDDRGMELDEGVCYDGLMNAIDNCKSS